MLKKRVFWPRSVLIRRKGVWLVCCCGSWSMYKCRFFYIQNVGTSVEQNGILDLIFLLWFNLKSHRFRLLYCRIRCGTWTTSIILMFQQQWHTRKCSRTCLTIIFLHHRMCLKVSAKIRSIGECTITILTCKRFLSRMRSNVTYLLKKEIKKINFCGSRRSRMSRELTLQQPWSRECFTTQFTFTWQCMGSNVHL